MFSLILNYIDFAKYFLIFFLLTYISCLLWNKLSLQGIFSFLKFDLSIYFKKIFLKNFETIYDNEINKFAILRILFGIILFIRFWNIIYFETNTNFLVYYSLILSACLIIGFLSQYALILLSTTIFVFGESIIRIETLGNDIGTYVAILLFFSNSSKLFSLDCILIQKFKIKNYYFLILSKNEDRVSLIKFLCLTAYSLTCIYSFSTHLKDEAWLEGYASVMLLGSQFMSQHHEFFEYVFSNFSYSIFLAKLSMFVMLLWYPVTLLFVLFGGIFKKFVVYWGFLFFLLSSFVLQLGSLGYIEFILWFGIFWNNFSFDWKKSIEVFYDDRCNLCDGTMKFLTFFDLFLVLDLKPISRNRNLLEKRKISYEKANEDLYCYDLRSKKIYFGYEFYLFLSKKIIILWPIFIILFSGKFLNIGKIVYAFIAKRRRKIFGICELSNVNDNKHLNYKISPNYFFDNIGRTIIVMLVISLFLYALQITKINNLEYDTSKFKKIFNEKISYFFGLQPIHVFDSHDLKMSERWFNIYYIDKEKNQKILIPFFEENGERGEYFKSDLMYFGRGLVFARTQQNIPMNQCWIDFYEKDFSHFVYEIVLSYKKLNKIKKKPPYKDKFIYEEYFKKLPNAEEINSGMYINNEKKLICSKKIIF